MNHTPYRAPPGQTAAEPWLPTPIVEGGLLLYWLAGGYGSVWVQDDFELERLQLLLYAGVPLATLYYGLWVLNPTWHRRWPVWRTRLAVAMVVTFFAGHIAWLNAISAEGPVLKRSVQTTGAVVNVDTRRGGLGLLFRTRW